MILITANQCLFFIHIFPRLPEELSEDQQKLVSRTTVVKIKTSSMKKGLAKQKNMLSARKKEHVSRNIQPPEDLTNFLQADETFEKIVETAKTNKEDILIRRYVMYVPFPNVC